MAERKDVASRRSADIERYGRESEPVLRPPVDILEDSAGITVQVDMPGVSKDQLDIQVDKDSLVVEGNAKIDMPEGMEALYADVRLTRYRRSFALSRDLQADKIDATLKDGVLTVRIPKREEVRPRKIEVRTA